MPSSLILPSGVKPSNLHLRDSVRSRHVDSDMFDICKRVREVDGNLHIVELEEAGTTGYAIMEHCNDGVERLVFRTDVLDGRVIQRLRYLMARPLNERMIELEADEYKFKADDRERELDDLYEKLGRPMLTQLEHDGFTQRPVSYPKRGVKATT